MKIILMGTPDFAVPAFEKLRVNGKEILCIVTQPDKKSGRGLEINFSPVKKWALLNNIPILQPEKLKDQDFLDKLKKLTPDIFIVVAFRILPKEVLEIPKWGSINLHASLLPKYRGAAPIQWSIANGDTQTGLTVFKLNEAIDAGKIISTIKTEIGLDETAGQLHDRLMIMGADLLVDSLNKIERGEDKFIDQNINLVSLAPKLKKEMGDINWNLSAADIYNKIRAFNPYPGSYTFTEQKLRLSIGKVEVCKIEHNKKPGTVLDINNGILIATKTDAIKILTVMPECKKFMTADEFVRGHADFLPKTVLKQKSEL